MVGSTVITAAEQTLGPPDRSLVTYTHVIYALHAASVLIGITSPVFIFTAFLFTWPSIVGVIMNYARRNAVRGTYLESHFRWQIRTFWFAALWVVVIAVLSLPLVPLFGLGLLTGYVLYLILGAWLIYRVARGWLRLKDGMLMSGLPGDPA